MDSKVFVHLTHLKLPQTSQIYLKIFIELLKEIHLKYLKIDFEVFLIILPKVVSNEKIILLP